MQHRCIKSVPTFEGPINRGVIKIMGWRFLLVLLRTLLKNRLLVERISLWTWKSPSSQERVTSAKSVSFFSSLKEDFMFSWKSCHFRQSFSSMMIDTFNGEILHLYLVENVCLCRPNIIFGTQKLWIYIRQILSKHKRHSNQRRKWWLIVKGQINLNVMVKIIQLGLFI